MAQRSCGEVLSGAAGADTAVQRVVALDWPQLQRPARHQSRADARTPITPAFSSCQSIRPGRAGYGSKLAQRALPARLSLLPNPSGHAGPTPRAPSSSAGILVVSESI